MIKISPEKLENIRKDLEKFKKNPKECLSALVWLHVIADLVDHIDYLEGLKEK